MVSKWMQELEENRKHHDERLEYHLAHPEMSPAEYSWQCRLQLGSQALSKLRIYLDQRYWIYCRDAKAGCPQRPVHRELLGVLDRLVQENRAICPASYPVLLETLKQQDTARRERTAAVIDQLSQGVALQPPVEITRIELMHLLRQMLTPEAELWPLDQAVWNHVGYVCGEMVPTCAAVGKDFERAMQKATFDLTASLSFSALVDSHPPDVDRLQLDDSAFQAEQERQSALHRSDYRSYEEVFQIEVAGFLSVLRPVIEDAVQYLRSSGSEDANGRGRMAESALITRLAMNGIYHAYRLGKLSSELPALHIGSGIHAAIRHQNRRRKKGDLQDHEHAAVALPYCDLFLTERTLGTLLTKPPLEFHKTYGCKVLWKDDEVLEELRSLSR